MIYKLSIAEQATKAKERFNYLVEKKATIELIEKKANRSLSQNRYLHLLIGKVALYTGYTIDFVKREFYKKTCNKEIFVTDVEGVMGIVEDVKSSRSLDTKQMTVSIERFRNWCAVEIEIYLPEPKDLNFENWCQEVSNELEQYSEQLYL